jgi:hypothetical protein
MPICAGSKHVHAFDFHWRHSPVAGVPKTRRAIMLKNLLVHIPSERQSRPVVDGAISLAMVRAAHLDAVSIGYETVSVGLAVGSGAAVATVFEVERKQALALAESALGVFETDRSAQRQDQL